MKKNEFPKIESGIREFFNKDRKFDSFVNEAKRSVHFGKVFSIKNASVPTLFRECVEIVIKKLKLNYDELFKGMVAEIKLKSTRNKIKFAEFECDEKSAKIIIQQISKENVESRTSIEVFKTSIFKKTKVIFNEFFKSESPVYGLKDELRKRAMKKRTLFKAALLMSQLHKKGYEISDYLWAEKIVTKAQAHGSIDLF